jgi:hypothetical protein
MITRHIARILTASLVLGTVALTVVRPGAAHAGTSPNLLDRNTGIVIQHPKIVNLYWDGNWDGDHPSFSRTRINSFTLDLLGNSHYLAGAAQYGVGSGTFGGSFTPNWLCGASHPASSIHFLDVSNWVTCEVLVPGTGVPYPDLNLNGIANTLYVVYLPRGTHIVDGITIPQFTLLGHTYASQTFGNRSCSAASPAGGYGGYHMVSFGGTNTFAYAVVLADCVGTDVGALTAGASHEVVEAATDPYPTASWINDSLSLTARLLDGEAGDICEGTPAAAIDTFSYARFWSNRDGRCSA